jgi:hypothetical protein
MNGRLTTIDSPLATLSPGDFSQLTILPAQRPEGRLVAQGEQGEGDGGPSQKKLSRTPRGTVLAHFWPNHLIPSCCLTLA